MIEVTYSDTVPVFVDHHDAEKHAQSEEEQAVDVVFDGVADGNAEGEQQNLREHPEARAEDDVADRPAVLEGTEDEDQLRHDIDDGADERPQDVDNPEANWLGVFEAGELLEGGDRDEEANTEDDEAGDAEEL